MSQSKMMFTESQQRAIDTRSKNVLVSAAAGSGKTAVLIERIIELILLDQVSLNNLVVLTFTNDAAKQMKNRLRKKIQETLNETEDEKVKIKLNNELLGLPLANISTFHAYCIKVLRDHYQYLGLSPSFSIIDENENTLLKLELMEKILEKHFVEEDAVFLELADLTISRVSTAPLVQLLLDVYEKTRAFVSPKAWRDEALSWYSDEQKIEQLYEKQVDYFSDFLKDIIEECQFFNHLLISDFPKNAALFDELSSLFSESKMLATRQFEEALEQLGNFAFPQFPRIKTDEKTTESDRAHKYYGNLRKQVKEMLESLSTLEEIEKQQAINAPIVKKIFALVEEFEQLFLQVKAQQHKVDFSDIEHFMLQLLAENDDVAAELSQTITEILVDEYQDTNEIQNAIIDKLRTPENRLFMVGDVKQSIYRFRLADPTIFLNKELNFGKSELVDEEELITLNQNFRSRKIILDAINHLSAALFKLDIDYTNEQALYYGNQALAVADDVPINWHFFDYERSLVNKFEKKAMVIVTEIEMLLREGTIFDKKTGLYRPIIPSDIAILSRNKSGKLITEIETLLSAKRIPFESKTDTGYFDAIEVKNMLSLLAILDNPFDDIAMLGYMLSPMGKFTSDELALILSFNKDANLEDFDTKVYHEYLRFYVENEVNNVSLVAKINALFEQLTNFRNKLEIWPLSKCLMYFYQETGYLNEMASLVDGDMRVANLKMLYELAKQKETIGFVSLRHFNRYISYLQKNDKDFALAKEVQTTEEMVTMMTIHGSKGLEFPIVFLVDLDKNFNKVASRSLYQIDKTFGFAFRVHDLQERTREKSWQYEFFMQRQAFDDRAEELRILYVALTRAEQSLHLFLDHDVDVVDAAIQRREVLSYKSFAEALLAVYAQSSRNEKWLSSIIDLEEVTLSDYIFEAKRQVETEKQLTLEDVNVVQTSFDFISSGLELMQYPQKQTVTELKEREAYKDTTQFASQDYLKTQTTNRERIELKQPNFMANNQDSFSATELGTYYHLILQYYDYYQQPKLTDFISLMIERQLLPKSVLPLIKFDKIEQTIDALITEYFDNGYEIVGKELPFSFSKKASGIYNNTDLFENERVIVQGKIDMLLAKDGRFIVIDFKSDRLNGIDNVEAFLMQRYHKQIELYEEAVQMYYEPVEILTRIYAIMDEI